MAKTVNKSTLVIEGQNKSAIAAIDGVAKKLGNAERSVKGFGSGIGGAFSSMSAMFTSLPFMAATAVTGMVAGFGTMIKSSIDAADRFSKMSESIGISVENLSTLSYAAKLSGTDIESMNTSLSRLSRNILDANNGLGGASRGFNELDIQLKTSEGILKNTDEVMLEISEKFKEMPDGAKKTALSMQLMGRAGAAMIPLLNEGAEGIAKLQEKARELGIEIDTETAQKAETFNDIMTEFSATIEGLSLTVLPTFLDILIDTTFYLRNFSLENLVKSSTIAGMAELNAELALYRVELDLSMKKERERREQEREATQEIKNRTKEIEDQIRAAERLAAQWNTTSNSLMNEMATAGLKGVALEFTKIDLKVNDLYEKFGNKQLIDEWAEAMKVALLDVNNIDITAFDMPDSQSITELLPKEFDRTMYEAEKAAIQEVTDLELANLVIRTSATENMFSDMAGAAYQFYSASGEQSKAAFSMFKALAIAETSINTYNAAVAAYKSMVGIPIVGPGLAVAAAAAATAYGIGQISRISSMTPGGRASAGGSTSVPTVPQTNNQTINENNHTINLTINSKWQDPDELARTLVPALNKAIKDGVG